MQLIPVKKQFPTKLLGVNVEIPIVVEIDKLAKQNGLSRTQVTERLLYEGLLARHVAARNLQDGPKIEKAHELLATHAPVLSNIWEGEQDKKPGVWQTAAQVRQTRGRKPGTKNRVKPAKIEVSAAAGPQSEDSELRSTADIPENHSIYGIPSECMKCGRATTPVLGDMAVGSTAVGSDGTGKWWCNCEGCDGKGTYDRTGGIAPWKQ